MKYSILLTLLVNFSFMDFNLCQDDPLPTSPPPPTPTKSEPKIMRGDELFFGISNNYSFRTLAEREGLFGDPLGIRVGEIAAWNLSAELGYRIKMKPYFSLVYGIEFNQVGVNYENTQDSSFLGYELKKQSILIPVRASFQKGETWMFQCGLGAAPKMFFNTIYTERFEDSFGMVEEISTNQKDPYNGFNLELMLNMGFRWNFAESFGLYFIPEFRYELLDNFKIQEPHVQRFYGLHLRWGIQLLF